MGIRTKLMILVSVTILFVAVIIGGSTYYFAKRELEKAGISELQQIVSGAIAVADTLNDEVKSGSLTLKEAQEQARIKINGPLHEATGERDMSNSSFLYGQEGYMWAYNDEHISTMHPYGLEGEDSTDFQTSDGMYLLRELIVLGKESNPDDRILTYLWENPGEEGERTQISYVDYYEPWGWTFGIAVYPEEFYGSLSQLKTVVILTIIGMLIVTLGFIYIYLKRYHRSIRQMTQRAEQISKGDLQGRTIEIASKDEFGRMAHSFNTMTEELNDFIHHTKKYAMEVGNSAKQVQASAEETNRASEEIAHSITSVASGTEKQSFEMKETNDEMHIVAAELNRVSQEVIDVSKESKHSSDAAKAGNIYIVNTNDKMNEILVKTKEAQETITSLDKQSNDIEKMVTMISELTEQTNLLSLNASIEAARAGEHGRGFAVVAQEVRKLAEQSSAAAESIGTIVRDVKHETSSALMSIEGMTGSVSQGVEAIQEAQQSFDEIVTSTEKASQKTENVTEKIKALNSNIHETLRSIEQMNSIIQGHADSIDTIAASAEEQHATMDNVSHLANQLSQVAVDLEQLLERFEVSAEKG